MARVLICEDGTVLRKIFKAYFSRQKKHTGYIASDGIEGLNLIEQKRPDLVLTDISMPNLDGFQLAQAIRENAELKDTPIIFITGFDQRDDIKEADRYNPVGYLVKPFKEPEMWNAIEDALKGVKDA